MLELSYANVVQKYCLYEFLLWHPGIGSFSETPGNRFDPSPAQWIKGACTAAVAYRLQLQLRCDPWCRPFDGHGGKKKKKRVQSTMHTHELRKKYHLGIQSLAKFRGLLTDLNPKP